MSARALSVLTVGAALLIAGCSSSEGGTASPAPSSTPVSAESSPAQPTTSAPPSSSTQATTSAASGSSSSVDGAVERYETFLHAVGKEDVTTVCEIAGPAAKKAEDEGFGTCEQTIPITFQMISAAQKQALQSATVDQSGITEDSATKVEIPATAVKAAVKFTDSDLGDATLEYRSGKWYIIDN